MNKMINLGASLALVAALGACGDDGEDDDTGLTATTDPTATATGTDTTDPTDPTNGTDTTDPSTTGDPTDPTDPTATGTTDPTATGTTDPGTTTGDPTTTSADTGTTGDGLSFEVDIYDGIISANCSCHVGGSSGGLEMPDATTAYGNLVNTLSTQSSLDRVEPEDSTQSYLWHKLSGTHLDAPAEGSGDQMPLGGAPLPQASIDLIADWIDEGAAP